MQNALLITFHDLPHDEDIEAVIGEKFEKLKNIIGEVTKCHVVLEKLSKHHHKGNLACARLDLKVSHFDDIVITEKCTEDAASLKSAVIKIFKRAQILAKEEIKRRQDAHRVGNLKAAAMETETVEAED